MSPMKMKCIATSKQIQHLPVKSSRPLTQFSSIQLNVNCVYLYAYYFRFIVFESSNFDVKKNDISTAYKLPPKIAPLYRPHNRGGTSLTRADTAGPFQ